MAEDVASCSDPWVTTTVLSMTFTELMRMLKQSTTRVGSKSARVAIVVRDSRLERWTTLSNDVLSVHEMHRKSHKIVCWSNPFPGVEDE